MNAQITCSLSIVALKYFASSLEILLITRAENNGFISVINGGLSFDEIYSAGPVT
ncbi:hypothetical protein J7L05_02025 [bacterium]|nr:hypothetical protein [bacterium]